MIKMYISLIMMFISIIMLFINHPLSMGLMILIQTLLLCIISGMIINTYWFSYILFLIFLGGLLVLFIYVSSIASNEMFKMMNYMIIMIFISSLFIISIIYNPNLKWLNFFFNDEMLNFFSNFMFFNNENKINLSKLYNNNTLYLMLMMIVYLYITLIAVVKITNIFFGPLRSNF
uniref:NADH-ubiquinone oxidoreductase chain 6 n=1 Tax=Ideopsis similis TaxID=228300 RepID=A0A068BCS4_9NEOP|nr:NADH dehydrogenase subunit 6 [Ideopsis similis]AIC83190.1 NADH dehydrogenase subunit 6 [Ideopsis similis]